MRRGRKRIFRKVYVTMPCRLGLHLRTAAHFVEFARQFHSSIYLRRDRLVADGKNVLGLLLLGASWNARLCVLIRGEDAGEAVQAIRAYFRTDEHCADEPMGLDGSQMYLRE